MKESIATLTARIRVLEACVAGLALTHHNPVHGWPQVERLVAVALQKLRAEGCSPAAIAAFEQTAKAAQKRT